MSLCSDYQNAESDNDSQETEQPPMSSTSVPIQSNHLLESNLETSSLVSSLNNVQSLQSIKNPTTLIQAAPSISLVKPQPLFDSKIYTNPTTYGPTPKHGNLDRKKNILTGKFEPSYISNFEFDKQYHTFHSYGHCKDPGMGENRVIKNTTGPEADKMIIDEKKTVFEKIAKRPKDKRKRDRNNDPSDIEGYLGPWGGFVNEVKVCTHSEDDKKYLDEYLSKMKSRKVGKVKEQEEEEVIDEYKDSFELHISDPLDYQGRSFVNKNSGHSGNPKQEYVETPSKCFLPSKCTYTWKGHTKAISKLAWFPKSAHLFLSCSVDTTIKLWEFYQNKRVIMTYKGHSKAIRDIDFNKYGTTFASCAYDKILRIWDTEKGACISKIPVRRIPYCVRFNPKIDSQDRVLVGTSSKKILCFDTRTKGVTQEYDRHMGAVNALEFIDFGKRFVSSSDDKSLRIWEWNIPVDFKCISDPTMHASPAMGLSPDKKWLLTQSMDNTILTYNALQVCRKVKKKTFKGHMVAGYSCTLGFSPDMSYVISGDADGKAVIWDWKTTNLVKSIKAHTGVCGNVLWHPFEASKMITSGWDGLVKLWDS